MRQLGIVGAQQTPASVCSTAAQPLFAASDTDSMQGVVVSTSSLNAPRAQSRRTDETRSSASRSVVVIGGGVSGIYAALTLAELGHRNVTILEREPRVGGKAASFSFKGQAYPLGAVGTPLALEKASFAESQLFERPLKFAASLFGRTGRRLQVLNANHLVAADVSWPAPFPKEELTSSVPVADWQRAFGASGRPERFYPHTLDFTAGAARELASDELLPKIVPRWGGPRTSWPLVYVSAHGYGVAEAADAPPYYYWARFAQKSTNAGAKGPLGMALPGHSPAGPRGPALRGWDSSSLLEQRLSEAGVRVRTAAQVTSVARSEDDVLVKTADGTTQSFDQLVLASDLRGALSFLDADETERALFGKVRHLPYYTVTSHMTLPWLASGSVYYLAEHQAPLPGQPASDAGAATAGCPTILLKPHADSNLTISWAYGGEGVGAPQMEACLARTVARHGGRFGGVHFVKPWHDYFPHVPAAELAANYHQKLDALQGKRRTLMVGEIFNLPLVSECVDFARYLMRRHFAPAGGAGGGAGVTSALRSGGAAAGGMRQTMQPAAQQSV